MSQKISRRTRRRRQAIRESWAEVERRQIAQANWSAFLSAEIEIRSMGKMFATSVRIHPEHGVPVVTVATSNESLAGRIFAVDSNIKSFVRSFEDAARAILSPFEHATGPVWSPELLKVSRGLCPNCGGGSVRNVWGMTNADAECIACGTIFNSFERMLLMDRLSAEQQSD